MATAQTELITLEDVAQIRADFEHHIAEIEKQCKAISIVNVDDRVGYESAKDYRARVRKIRTTIKKLIEERKRPFLDMQRELIDCEKLIVGLLKPSEDHLDAQIKRIDDEKKRIEDEKARAAQIQFERRVKLLSDLGAPIDPAAIRAMLPEEWAHHLKLAEIAKAERDKAEAEEAARRKAELEQRAKDQAELELLRKEQARRDAEARAAKAAEQPVQQEQPKPFITDTIPASNEPEPGVMAGPPGTRSAVAEPAQVPANDTRFIGVDYRDELLELLTEVSLLRQSIPKDATWAKKADRALWIASIDLEHAPK